MTDPIHAALERLQEYAAAHPEHDTGELVAAALAALTEEPTFIASEPSDEDLADLVEVFNGDPLPAMRRALELWGRHTTSAVAAEPPAPVPSIPRPAVSPVSIPAHISGWAPASAPAADLTPAVYDAKAGTRIELTRATPCPLWAVRNGAYRMSIHGEWSFEPMPSSRTADYLAMHSFPSPAAAWAELQRYREAAASFDGPQPPQGGEVEA